jgi:anti-anti-sigma factor
MNISLSPELDMSDLLQVSTQTLGDVEIVLCTGRMDASSCPLCEKAIQGLIKSGKQRIVFNGSGLSYISSAGLRILLATKKDLSHLGGDLRLACLTPAIRDVITMTGFNRIFTLYESESEAVASFS